MNDIHMPDESYLDALIRIHDIIKNGLRKYGHDDCTIGCKSTECSWGLCMDDKEHWPDPNDYLWPDNPNRVAPKYLTEHQKCPLDMRTNEEHVNQYPHGCFYSCMFFKGKQLSKEQALELYAKQIEYTKRRIGVKNV